jgi:hypothetical protein
MNASIVSDRDLSRLCITLFILVTFSANQVILAEELPFQATKKSSYKTIAKPEQSDLRL